LTKAFDLLKEIIVMDASLTDYQCLHTGAPLM